VCVCVCVCVYIYNVQIVGFMVKKEEISKAV